MQQQQQQQHRQGDHNPTSDLNIPAVPILSRLRSLTGNSTPPLTALTGNKSTHNDGVDIFLSGSDESTKKSVKTMGNQSTATELSAISTMVLNVSDMLVSMKKEEHSDNSTRKSAKTTSNQTTATKLSAISTMVSNVSAMIESMEHRKIEREKREEEYQIEQEKREEEYQRDGQKYRWEERKRAEEYRREERAYRAQQEKYAQVYRDNKEKDNREYKQQQQQLFTTLMTNMQSMALPNLQPPSTPNQHLQPQTQITVPHNAEMQFPQNTVSPPSGGKAQQ